MYERHPALPPISDKKIGNPTPVWKIPDGKYTYHPAYLLHQREEDTFHPTMNYVVTQMILKTNETTAAVQPIHFAMKCI